ncbi:cyclic AMP-responsive element-binding protein 3-like protein 1 [Arapaima gigas]
MEGIMDSFAPEKLFPNPNLLDLEDLNESDFLTNVVRCSFTVSSQTARAFPATAGGWTAADAVLFFFLSDVDSADGGRGRGRGWGHVKVHVWTCVFFRLAPPESEGMWSFSQDLTAILVKQEPAPGPSPSPSPTPSRPAEPFVLAPPSRKFPAEEPVNSVPAIKAEPPEANQFPGGSSDERLQLPPTPPSSHGSDSDGSQSPRSLPPPSPARMQPRTSAAISSSPLLTAPHKLQGTSGPLVLTEEEKRTLIAEGYPVPNKLPLTKTEEKALKRVRRKIKNKISAQESRRKKKEYVECLEKRVETYTTENNELWKKVETLESANRSLLQQLQKLQTLVAGKVPRSCKMASTQTGTCLMVVALCFVLVLGSFVPCLPEFSSSSNIVKSSPLSSADVYTASQVRSRSLLFYEESSPLEDGYGPLLKVSEADKWEGPPGNFVEDGPVQDPRAEHETTKYLSKDHADVVDYNRTGSEFGRDQERFLKRETTPDGNADYF